MQKNAEENKSKQTLVTPITSSPIATTAVSYSRQHNIVKENLFAMLIMSSSSATVLPTVASDIHAQAPPVRACIMRTNPRILPSANFEG